MQPNPPHSDDELDAFFDGKEHIDIPADDLRVEDLDTFSRDEPVYLPEVQLDCTPGDLHQMATIPPPEEATNPYESPPSADLANLPEAVVNHSRYRIIRLLGQGGMGAVYEAEHRLMHRPVALKLVHSYVTANPAAAERFRREVRTAARLHHANIVQSFDAEQAGGLHILVMEYVEGQTLAEYLGEQGPLPIAEACNYARQVAQGLQYAHERQMIHRDIKPHNLMRTPTGVIKILDFGLARWHQGMLEVEDIHGEKSAPVSSQLTQVGSVMGTPDYMAPEQGTDSSQVDIRADIYSLGCTLYQLLSGRLPFPEGTALDKLVSHATRNATPLRQLRPEIPEQLEAVVAKMMARQPADRFHTPAEVIQALEPYEREAIHSPADSPRRVHWVGIAAGLVTALVALMALGYFFLLDGFDGR